MSGSEKWVDLNLDLGSGPVQVRTMFKQPWTFNRVFTEARSCIKNNDRGYTSLSLLLQIHWVRPTMRHQHNNFLSSCQVCVQFQFIFI
jgi:hypothetical protein